MTDFKRQFQNLLRTMPRYNLKQVQSENCDYSDTAVKSKNCYYCFGAFYCEDVYYGRYSRKCIDCVGVTLCVNCEGCVECTDCANSYFLSYCRDCKNTSDSLFCHDCYSCQSCFGCVGLYGKEYCLFNEPLTKSDYQQWLKAINIAEESQRTLIVERLNKLKHTVPLPAVHLLRAENCIGNNLTECDNCYECYDAFLLEDCLFTIEANANKSCADLTVCFEAELCYCCVQSPLNYNCNFLFHSDQCSDSEFCAYSKRLKNCYGCVYLSDKEYHILNQPVPKDEYHDRIRALSAALQKTGNYNLKLYFASDYETGRMNNETDCAIAGTGGEG